MLLHWLASLVVDARKTHPHSGHHQYGHCASLGHAAGHSLGDKWPFPDPQHSNRHPDVYPYHNLHRHQQPDPSTLFHAVPALDEYPGSQFDPGATHGHLHFFAGPADVDLYPRSTHTHLYLLASAAHADLYPCPAHGNGNGDYGPIYNPSYSSPRPVTTLPFKVAQTHA